jgi:flagellar biosynthesis protein FlhF
VAARLCTSGELIAPDAPRRVLALVGPAGVGKTTTAAKLAARAALVDGLRVAVVAFDPRRLGGVEQVRRWGDLIGVPVEVARGADALRDAVATHEDAAAVLIDTSGFAARDTAAIERTARAVRAVPSVSVSLCLAVATRRGELDDTVDAWRPAAADCLLFTKADEARAHGALLNASARTSTPISYVADGPRVPEDLRVAEVGPIAEAIAGIAPAADKERSWARAA